MINIFEFSKPLSCPDPCAIYVSPEEIPINDHPSYRGSTEDAAYLPLNAFLSYYSLARHSQMWSMQHDFVSIRHSLEDLEHAETKPNLSILSSDKLKRVEKALQKSFTSLKQIPLNKIVVTDKSIQVLFPPLIKDTPFTSSIRLNRRLWVLPFQIAELFFRTIFDLLVSLSLSIYGLANPDRAEYLKARLSITHNNSLRAIWTNIYNNL